MGRYSHKAFNKFIDDMHSHFAKRLPEIEQWEGVRPLLKTLISDQEILNTSKGWEKKKGREYILHHEPKFDFFVGVLVREPKHIATAHDHGPPHIPHAENGNSPRSVAITVRTTKPGSYDQIMFNLETGKTGVSRGLELVPLAI